MFAGRRWQFAEQFSKDGPKIVAKRQFVFVVDDDRSVLRSIERLLREHGFDAKVFDSASALLGQGDFGEAGCIILDINLNDQSGIDLRRRLADQASRRR